MFSVHDIHAGAYAVKWHPSCMEYISRTLRCPLKTGFTAHCRRFTIIEGVSLLLWIWLDLHASCRVIDVCCMLRWSHCTLCRVNIFYFSTHFHRIFQNVRISCSCVSVYVYMYVCVCICFVCSNMKCYKHQSFWSKITYKCGFYVFKNNHVCSEGDQYCCGTWIHGNGERSFFYTS